MPKSNSFSLNYSKRIAWFLPLLWLSSIYIFIFYARDFQSFVQQNFGREVFTYAVICCLFCLIGFFYKAGKKIKFKFLLFDFFITLIVLILYFYKTLSLSKSAPEEAMHFVQYGVLYFLIYKLLLCYSKHYSILLTTLVLTTIFGIFDEVIQWLVPERYFDWRDVGLNFFSAAMVFLLILFPFRQKSLSYNFAKKPLILLISSSLISLSLIVICLLNTQSYSKGFLLNSFNLKSSQVMTEYGFLYEGEKNSIFKSRLEPKMLLEKDLSRGSSFAREIENLSLDFNSKLIKYDTQNYPYEHEVIVRTNRMESLKIRSLENEYLEEGRILLNFFPNFFNKFYGADDIKKISKAQISSSYVSPVSANLITKFRKNTVIKFYLFSSIILISLFIIVFYSKKEQ